MLSHPTRGGSRRLDVKIVLWWRNSACYRDFCHRDSAMWKQVQNVWDNGRLVGQAWLWQRLREWEVMERRLLAGNQEYVWNLGSLRRVWETGGGRDCWEWKWMGDAVAKMQVVGILASRMEMKSWVVVAVGTSALSPRDLKCLALHWQGTSALKKAADAF